MNTPQATGRLVLDGDRLLPEYCSPEQHVGCGPQRVQAYGIDPEHVLRRALAAFPFVLVICFLPGDV